MNEMVVELRGEHALPDEVAVGLKEEVAENEKRGRATALSAYSFSADTGCAYHFGISRDSVARTLRQLADDFERGALLPQRAQVTSEARRSDYAFSALVLEFAERKQEDAQSANGQ